MSAMGAGAGFKRFPKACSQVRRIVLRSVAYIAMMSDSGSIAKALGRLQVVSRTAALRTIVFQKALALMIDLASYAGRIWRFR